MQSEWWKRLSIIAILIIKIRIINLVIEWIQSIEESRKLRQKHQGSQTWLIYVLPF